MENLMLRLRKIYNRKNGLLSYLHQIEKNLRECGDNRTCEKRKILLLRLHSRVISLTRFPHRLTDPVSQPDFHKWCGWGEGGAVRESPICSQALSCDGGGGEGGIAKLYLWISKFRLRDYISMQKRETIKLRSHCGKLRILAGAVTGSTDPL